MFGALIVFLLTAMLWPGNVARKLQYRGETRWGGPWNNPIHFGLLLGAALVLAIGWVVSNRKRAEGMSLKVFYTVSFSATIILCSYGLLKSYSRGAWVATTIGIFYLLFQIANGEKGKYKTNRLLFGRNWRAAGMIAATLVVFSFCNFDLQNIGQRGGYFRDEY